jgi:protein-disulfide isomerase
VLVVFSDFQCPFCGVFARETVPALRRQYVDDGTLILVFRHFPLPIHAFARRAAAAAVCAAHEGKFWDMHDRLFEKPRRLTQATVESLASQLGMDASRLAACEDEADVTATVSADVEMGNSFVVSSTPTVFVGLRIADNMMTVYRKLSGALPLGEYQTAIDHVLAQRNK